MNEFNFDVTTIAIGRKFNYWALIMIETLRANGQYYGQVYVITDRPEIYKNIKNLTTIVAPNNGVAFQAKLYKTKLFDLIQSERILYIDVDVVIGKPLNSWFMWLKSHIHAYKIAMFRDTGLRKGPYHTGVIYMQRSAKPILTKWRNQIENHRFQRDQKALASCLQPNEAIIMPEEYLMFPIQKDIEGGVVSTFVHITFGGRQQGQHRLYKIGPYLSKAFSVKFTKHPHVFINNFIDDLFYLIKRKYSLLKNYLKTLINTSA